MNINLPESFLKEMQDILKDEYEDYLKSFDDNSYTALRLNRLKIDKETFKQLFNLDLEEVTWTDNGFYIDKNDSFSKSPFYKAGLYYLQEPSAMTPASFMPINDGDKVLDLCAAPGGKSTELLAKLNNTGVLFANDISFSRCAALLSNLEKFGGRNYFVMSEDSNKLAKHFNQYFDKILIDAPCSGEGMFRKDHHLIDSFIERGPEYYATIQKRLILDAAKMLKEGGMVLYSTCTFSPLEDEEIIKYLLENEEDFEVVQLPLVDGFIDTGYGMKLFPHRIKGEGHFVSLLRKKGTLKANPKRKPFIYETDDLKMVFDGGSLSQIKDKLYYIPDTDLNLAHIRFLRTGLLLGEYKRNRLEIDPLLALALKDNEFKQTIDYQRDDPSLNIYFKGGTLSNNSNYKKGLVLLRCEGYPIGFGKIDGPIIKNKYPKGWITCA